MDFNTLTDAAEPHTPDPADPDEYLDAKIDRIDGVIDSRWHADDGSALITFASDAPAQAYAEVVATATGYGYGVEQAWADSIDGITWRLFVN